MRRSIILLLAALLVFGLQGCSDDGSDGAQGAQGDPGPAGPPGDSEPTTAVETCVGCHDQNGAVPIYDITDRDDPHFIDTVLPAPETDSGLS